MIAQLVEHDLAKVGVASSSLVHRSMQDQFLHFCSNTRCGADIYQLDSFGVPEEMLASMRRKSDEVVTPKRRGGTQVVC